MEVLINGIVYISWIIRQKAFSTITVEIEVVLTRCFLNTDEETVMIYLPDAFFNFL